MSNMGEGAVKSDEKKYLMAVEEWKKDNGKGFHKGFVKIREYKGKISPSTPSTTCVVEDNRFVWTAYFKGAVFAYDKQKDISYVVYNPEMSYNWIGSMVSGRKYLWMNVRLRNGLLAFDKNKRVLEIVEIPQLKTIKNARPGQS